MDDESYVTPRGMKVHLDMSHLIVLVLDDINGDPCKGKNRKNIITCLHWAEAFMEFRHCFTWYALLFFIIMTHNANPLLIGGYWLLLYLYGVSFALVPLNITLTCIILHFLYFPYYACRNGKIRAVITILLAIIFKQYLLVLYFCAFKVFAMVMDFMISVITGKITLKKYGIVLTDIELSTIRSVYIFMNNNLEIVKQGKFDRYSKLILWYLACKSVEQETQSENLTI